MWAGVLACLEEDAMTIARILYWFLTGALIGVGFLAILSSGLPLLVFGIILLVVGAVRFGGKEAFAALVSFGAAPAAILLWDVTSGPWACDNGGFSSGSSSSSSLGGGSVEVAQYSCVDTPFGQLTTYHVLAAGFIVLALVGLALLLVSVLRLQVRQPASA